MWYSRFYNYAFSSEPGMSNFSWITPCSIDLVCAHFFSFFSYAAPCGPGMPIFLLNTPSSVDLVCAIFSSYASSSSCHQTSVFHVSTHFFAVSLNLLRSSNEQGCARRVHCIMSAVFSVARPHSRVVSPS